MANDDQPVGILTQRSLVMSWECDQMEHLNTRYYASRFDEAGACLMELSTCDVSDVDQSMMGWADVKITMEIFDEVHDGAMVSIFSTVDKIGNSSVTTSHTLYVGPHMRQAAKCSRITVRMNMQTRRPAPLETALRKQFERMAESV